VYGTAIIRWAAGPVVFALAMLMVSRFEFPHVFNLYFSRRRPPTHLVGLVVAALIAWFSPELLLFLLAYAYLAGGLIGGLVVHRRRRGQRSSVVKLAESELPQDAN
jgi:phosphatidylserine synthase